MSMGVILKIVRDSLQTALSLDKDACGVQSGGRPPNSAGELYLAVDELGVQSTARAHLREVYELEIALWRRGGQYADDRHGDVLLADDPYLAGVRTLDALERDVIRHVHGNYSDITAAANAEIGAGGGEAGDIFQLALYYVGRGRTETIPRPAADRTIDWIGRRLKFLGMTRVQALDIAE